jgi:hypothetical protein
MIFKYRKRREVGAGLILSMRIAGVRGKARMEYR